MNETWKQIPGFDGYEASSFGRVRYTLRWKNPRILKGSMHSRGYLKVSPSIQGRSKDMFVHRLVAMAFLPNKKKLPQVNHKNFDKTDNRPANLEWVSGNQNVSHAVANRLYPSGEAHHNAKLSDVDVAVIRSCGLSHLQAAQRFGVSKGHIKQVRRGMWRLAAAPTATKEG